MFAQQCSPRPAAKVSGKPLGRRMSVWQSRIQASLVPIELCLILNGRSRSASVVCLQISMPLHASFLSLLVFEGSRNGMKFTDLEQHCTPQPAAKVYGRSPDSRFMLDDLVFGRWQQSSVLFLFDGCRYCVDHIAASREGVDQCSGHWSMNIRSALEISEHLPCRHHQGR
jgi:hypothetical protein